MKASKHTLAGRAHTVIQTVAGALLAALLAALLTACASGQGSDREHHAHGHDDAAEATAAPDAVEGGVPDGRARTRFDAAQDALESVAFIAGVWEREEDETWHQEVWSAPRGDRMVGHAHLVRGGRTSFTEALEIRVLAGVVIYVATPEDQATTVFPLVESAPGYARFEAPEHDFPRVIEYRLDGDGALLVRLLGEGRPARADGDGHTHAATERELALRFVRGTAP